MLQAQKEELINLYNTPWELLDSGEIRLDLDLHFKFNNIRYNCDFKSGFSSNEKGNTNRLLLVASIYSKINQHGKNILFVRQPEDENNHYLQTLKHSSYWEVFCSNDCYEEIKNFTGYDLRSWLDKNADWENDISKEFKDYLYAQSLIKYLTW